MKFFKKIRQKLLSENKLSRYLIYASGEIVLVVIGILIAVSINNWNEDRKSKIASNEIQQNLLETLRQDSIKIVQIISIQKRSIDAQEMFITSKLESNYIVKNNLLYHIIQGANSFFPNTGPYNSLVSNSEMKLILSKDLRVKIINLYDYQFKRYENIDAIVDGKFQNQIFSVIDKKMMKYSVDSSSGHEKLNRRPDPILIEQHYTELESKIKDTYRVMNTGYMSLLAIQKSINQIITDLREELKK